MHKFKCINGNPRACNVSLSFFFIAKYQKTKVLSSVFGVLFVCVFFLGWEERLGHSTTVLYYKAALIKIILPCLVLAG